MLKDMKSRKHLKPGQAGTKRLVEQYGDSLVCVRYRYDAQRGITVMTAEIIVEERAVSRAERFQDDDPVKLIVAYTEKSLRKRLKAAGGRWYPQEKLWLVRYGAIRGTELEERIWQVELKGTSGDDSPYRPQITYMRNMWIREKMTKNGLYKKFN